MHITVTADTLVLRQDGRYVRSYRAPGEAVVIDSGGWFLSKNGRLVALRDYPKRWRWVHDCMYTGTVCKALTEPSMLALTVERPLGPARSALVGTPISDGGIRASSECDGDHFFMSESSKGSRGRRSACPLVNEDTHSIYLAALPVDVMQTDRAVACLTQVVTTRV